MQSASEGSPRWTVPAQPAGGGNSFAQDLANETGANVTGAKGANVYTYNDPPHQGRGFLGVPHPSGCEANSRPPVKCGTWDTVGPQNAHGGGGPRPPPGIRVPPGMDPSQRKPAWVS